MPGRRETPQHALERKRMAELGARTRKAVRNRLAIFPQGEHDDLFDGLQTMVEGAMGYATVRAERHLPFSRW